MNYLALSLGILNIIILVTAILAIHHRRKKKEINLYSSIAHELCSPLAYIMGPLKDLSKDTTIPLNSRHTLGEIHNRIAKLADYAEAVIEYNVSRKFKSRLAVRHGDLSLFVEKAVTEFESRVAINHIKLKLELEQNICLWFDPNLLNHALNLILNNAIYNSNIELIKISLIKDVKGDEAILSVIFSETINEDYSKNISLALVEEICKCHKIKFDTRSQKGVGSIAYIRFDMTEDYSRFAADIISDTDHEFIEEVDDTLEASDKESILIIEEDEDICNYIREILSDRYSLHFSHNGKEGQTLTHKLKPDLIISAIILPGMSGLELCKSLKHDGITANIPIILLTGKHSNESRIEAYSAGADSYITKPFTGELLSTRVDNILSSRQRLIDSISSGEHFNTKDHHINRDALVERFKKIVEDNLNLETLDIHFIANELSMSQSTLYRKIKMSSGLSPIEMIKNIRLDKAAELLSSSDKTISEISWLVGITSPVYFRNCFKERFGETPSQYREETKFVNANN